jgi:hypothetical protein
MKVAGFLLGAIGLGSFRNGISRFPFQYPDISGWFPLQSGLKNKPFEFLQSQTEH